MDDPSIGAAASVILESWEGRGSVRSLLGHPVFVVDQVPIGDLRHEPLVVLHGFPTSSLDFRYVLPELAAHRRVVLFDMLGYGLSEKPDAAYTLAGQADLAEALLATLGLTEVALLTHDMGDTVGGELLARTLDGSSSITYSRRVVTNGSIYIEMAHLTDGQNMLLSLPDALLPEGFDLDAPGLAASLTATFSPGSAVDPNEVLAGALAIRRSDGHRVLPRTIRYIEERRANQARFTGAIETHPSPLAIVWGADDPIALVTMAGRLSGCRPEAPLTVLDGVGHYPMIEAPSAFAAAITAFLTP